MFHQKNVTLPIDSEMPELFYVSLRTRLGPKGITYTCVRCLHENSLAVEEVNKRSIDHRFPTKCDKCRKNHFIEVETKVSKMSERAQNKRGKMVPERFSLTQKSFLSQRSLLDMRKCQMSQCLFEIIWKLIKNIVVPCKKRLPIMSLDSHQKLESTSTEISDSMTSHRRSRSTSISQQHQLNTN